MNPEAYQYLQWLFSFHRLVVRQKIWTLSEKYQIEDDNGQPRFTVVRPPHIAQTLLANIIGGLISLTFLGMAVYSFIYWNNITLAVALFFSGGFVSAIISTLISPFRDIYVYAGEQEENPVLTITQDNKIAIHYFFTIYDALGTPIGRARRNALKALYRREWVGLTMDERWICRVREDSLLLALLRRYLGPLYGLLMTNFDFETPEGQRIGEYNRKYTIRDTYVLDLSADNDYLLDRRVALSLAVLLDTGEGR